MLHERPALDVPLPDVSPRRVPVPPPETRHRVVRLLLAAHWSLCTRWSVGWGTASFRTALWLNGATCGSGANVCGRVDVMIHRTARVRIGLRLNINSGFDRNPVGGYRRTQIWVGPGARLELGDDVGLSGNTIVCMHHITFEDRVIVGGGTSIYDSDFHVLPVADRAGTGVGDANVAPVLLGADSFIGADCTILKGVVIGRRSAVGARSVVTKNVPADEIWAGNPARFIRPMPSHGSTAVGRAELSDVK